MPSDDQLGTVFNLYFRLQFRFGETWGHLHNPDGAYTTTKVYELQDNEFLTSVLVRHGHWVDGLIFSSNKRTFDILGIEGGGQTTVQDGTALSYAKTGKTHFVKFTYLYLFFENC